MTISNTLILPTDRLALGQWKRALRKTLMGLYPMIQDQRRVVRDCGFDPGRIGWDTVPENTWFSIIEHASLQNEGLLRIIDYGLSEGENPGNTDLTRLRNGVVMDELKSPPVTGWTNSSQNIKQLQQLLGTKSTLVPVHWLYVGLQRAKSVAKIVLADHTSGSGFLIAGDRLVTNHHVLPDISAAKNAWAIFDYEENLSGLPREGERVKLNPDGFFLTSGVTDGDDFTVVAVQPGTCQTWGQLDLTSTPMNIREGDAVNIIQHPGGGTKKVSYVSNQIIKSDEKYLHYLTDTEPGSSGSPVFDHQWRLIGLHHASTTVNLANQRTVNCNEGIRIHRIASAIEQAKVGGQQ